MPDSLHGPSDSGGFEPILTFDRDSEDFALGFEAGRIWALLTTEGPDSLREQPFHATNVEMVLRMGESLGFELRAEFTDDPGWMVLA